MARTLGAAGQSITFSNLTLVAGFSVAALSGFPPVRTFGILTATTIALSYLGAIIVLPALIHTVGVGSVERVEVERPSPDKPPPT